MWEAMEIKMNRIFKIAALGAAVCVLSASLFSCGGDAQNDEYFAAVKNGSELATALDAGEILVHESITASEDIEGGYANGTSETHIRFTGENFELKSTLSSGENDSSTYELIKDGDTVIELKNGEGELVTDVELPDVFATFRVDFTAEDIEDVAVETELKGVKSYKLRMTKSYVNGFDSDTEGVVTDCTDVVYTYYITPRGELEKVVSEKSLTVTVGDKAQSVVKVVDSAIA